MFDPGPVKTCPSCGATDTWDTMAHEPWCPNFLRCVDESADAQLAFEETA